MGRANILNLVMCQMWVAREKECSNETPKFGNTTWENGLSISLDNESHGNRRFHGYYQVLSCGHVKFQINIRHLSEDIKNPVG